MSDNVDETRPAEQGYVNTTQQPANDIDFSQLYDMFMKIELRLPNFDDMLVAMNDYVFQRWGFSHNYYLLYNSWYYDWIIFININWKLI